MTIGFEMTENFKDEIEKTIKAYVENGIVTEKDVKAMGSRPGSRRLYDGLLEDGQAEAMIEEIHSPGYVEYSNVIYDPERYSHQEVKEYMIENVL